MWWQVKSLAEGRRLVVTGCGINIVISVVKWENPYLL
jgi:alpha-D-ribose 1-methylphosphonate 5-triphosphate synthase subunit PhnH